MDNVVGNLIGGMVLIIIAFNVVLPTQNTAIYGSSNSANLSTGNLALAAVLQTMVLLVILIYFVRTMIG